MKFDKALKVLWFVNGIILLLIGIFGLALIIIDSLPYRSTPNDIIVGQRLEDAKKDGLALQGISYSEPIPIYNSNHFYMTVSSKTYDESKMVLGILDSRQYSPKASSSYYGKMNIIFLNKDYSVLRTLLDRKGDIGRLNFAIPNTSVYKDSEKDPTVNNIAYKIAFEDSNDDGFLNNLDEHNLYISDIDGQNLIQVTDQLDIQDFNFQNANSELFIRFKERTGEPEEHIRERYAIYDIAKNKLRFLTSLDETLDKLEKTLIN